MSTGKVITVAELTEKLKDVKRNWEFIILHHSQTPDRKFLSDFEAIKNFHMSYRFKGDIITKEQADAFEKEGKKITLPWKDIAYHFVIEYLNNELAIREGRDIETSGAHCVGMNGRALGICLVGDYDTAEPVDEQLTALVSLCRALMNRFSIPEQNIKPHHFYASWKSCPGNKFPWMKFAKQIIDSKAWPS